MAFVSYSKLSKKKRREVDRAKRTTWGSVVPVTKKIPSDKIYNRKKARHRQGEPPDAGFSQLPLQQASANDVNPRMMQFACVFAFRG